MLIQKYIRKLKVLLIREELPIKSLHHFGSSVYLSNVKDIDILVIVEDNDYSKNYSYKEEMLILKNRMLGNFRLNSPEDFSVLNLSIAIKNIFENVIPFPVIQCFGPVDQLDSSTPYIHLNGPITQSMWKYFSSYFPIHAWVIRNNCISYIGKSPEVSKIYYTHLKEYISIMKNRLKKSDPQKIVQKLLQTYGLLCGEKSCLLSKCLETSFTKSHPIRMSISNNHLSNADKYFICVKLLELLSICTEIMEKFRITYPYEL